MRRPGGGIHTHCTLYIFFFRSSQKMLHSNNYLRKGIVFRYCIPRSYRAASNYRICSAQTLDSFKLLYNRARPLFFFFLFHISPFRIAKGVSFVFSWHLPSFKLYFRWHQSVIVFCCGLVKCFKKKKICFESNGFYFKEWIVYKGKMKF